MAIRRISLPNIRKGRISVYWDKSVPVRMPETFNKFSFKCDPELRVQLTYFEGQSRASFVATDLKDESDLITEVKKDAKKPGLSYIGWFFVKNCNFNADDVVLIYPRKVGNIDAANVVAYNFVGGENGGWTKITDIAINNGFIYGKMAEAETPVIVFVKNAEEGVNSEDPEDGDDLNGGSEITGGGESGTGDLGGGEIIGGGESGTGDLGGGEIIGGGQDPIGGIPENPPFPIVDGEESGGEGSGFNGPIAGSGEQMTEEEGEW